MLGVDEVLRGGRMGINKAHRAYRANKAYRADTVNSG